MWAEALPMTIDSSIITAGNATYGNELYFKDLTLPNSPIVTIVDNFNSDSSVIENEGTKLYIENRPKCAQ